MKRYESILSEAVQRSNDYLSLIEEVILKNKNTIFKLNSIKINRFLISLSLILKKYAIKFKIDNNNEKSNYYGISNAETLSDRKNTIIIYCNDQVSDINKNDKYFSLFLIGLLDILGHEIIHRLQVINIKDKEILKKLSSKDRYSQEKYLSDKTEMIPIAWQIIEQFRFLKYSDNKILEIMQKHQHKDLLHIKIPEVYRAYINIFYNDKKVLNRLHKYMYEYLQ